VKVYLTSDLQLPAYSETQAARFRTGGGDSK